MKRKAILKFWIAVISWLLSHSFSLLRRQLKRLLRVFLMRIALEITAKFAQLLNRHSWRICRTISSHCNLHRGKRHVFEQTRGKFAFLMLSLISAKQMLLAMLGKFLTEPINTTVTSTRNISIYSFHFTSTEKAINVFKIMFRRFTTFERNEHSVDWLFTNEIELSVSSFF